MLSTWFDSACLVGAWIPESLTGLGLALPRLPVWIKVVWVRKQKAAFLHARLMLRSDAFCFRSDQERKY